MGHGPWSKILISVEEPIDKDLSMDNLFYGNGSLSVSL